MVVLCEGAALCDTVSPWSEQTSWGFAHPTERPQCAAPAHSLCPNAAVRYFAIGEFL